MKLSQFAAAKHPLFAFFVTMRPSNGASAPSWYLVATEDRMIPPDAQRMMSKRAGSIVAEVNGSHAVYVSQPQAVAAIITRAAHAVAVVA